MRKELKQPWIDALRSGKFSQTKGVLKGEFGYCCLGVLCEINNVFKEDLNDSLFDDDCKFTEWAQMDRGLYVMLATMNDEGKTFNEIADYLEKVL